MEFHFVLPTTSALSFNDQRALLIKQATAAIISSYLEHATLVNQANPDAGYRYNAQEVVDLVKNVQNALASA